MPFIDSKFTLSLSQDKKDKIKSELGKAISILNKPESYLMVGIQDNYELYFGGNKLEKGAFVDVSMLGNASSELCDKMTGEICRIFEKELNIPGNGVYITYQPIKHWGYNGKNF